MRKLASLVTLLALLLAGCSGGGAADQGSGASEVSPTVSIPTNSPPATTPSEDRDFATAVKFTKLVHKDEYSKAETLVQPGSAANRYVEFQKLSNKAQRIDGQDTRIDPATLGFDPNKKTHSIRIRIDDENPLTYVWKDFTFDQGKITGWTGKSGPVGAVLWTKMSKDSALGTTARLVSAYRANSGSMLMVVEFSSTRGADLGYMPSYVAKGGYRQNASSWSSQDELGKGEKTLIYYIFDDAKFGGKLYLKVASPTGYSTAKLELAIR
jgi:hypothetical protein